MWKLLAIGGALALGLAGCGNNAARQSEIQALQASVSADESIQDDQAKQIQNIQAELSRIASVDVGNWVLWASEEGFNAPYPSAQGAYQSKVLCNQAEMRYGYTDKRGFHPAKVISYGEPFVIGLQKTVWDLRCLPKGVKPLAAP